MTIKQVTMELEKLLRKKNQYQSPQGGGDYLNKSTNKSTSSMLTNTYSPSLSRKNTKTQYSNNKNIISYQTNTRGNSAGHLSTVKTNYTKGQKAAGKASAAAGYGASHGNASKSSNIGTRAAATESYQNRESSQSKVQKDLKQALELERGESMSNTYNRDGELMTQKEFKEYKSELAQRNIEGMRRIIISPDPGLNISPQEMSSITRDAMQSWHQYSGRQFDFTYAVHDEQSVIHSHILMTSQNQNDINMGSRQLEIFKTNIDEAIQNQIDLRLGLSESVKMELSESLIESQQASQDGGMYNSVVHERSNDNSKNEENFEEEFLLTCQAIYE